MLKIRIMPTLLLKDHCLIKGISFDSWRVVGTPIPSIKVYNLREVDEIVFLDISATVKNKPPDLSIVRDIASECFSPLTVGGGIKTLVQVHDLLRAGADKVCINSSAYDTPQLIRQTANQFGSQCVVVGIDFRKNQQGVFETYSHSGTHPCGYDIVTWAKKVEQLGAGEILLTSITRDGTMQGYDLDAIRQVTQAVTVPVIASGGAGNYAHLYEAITVGGASAVAASSIFHFTEQTPLGAKKYLLSKGIPIRQQTSFVAA